MKKKHNVVFAKEQINRAWNRIGSSEFRDKSMYIWDLTYSIAPRINWLLSKRGVIQCWGNWLTVSLPNLLLLFSCSVVSDFFCNRMDCSSPGSSVYRISQARILEWVAIPFSRGSSRPRDQTRVSCIAGRFFTTELQGSQT